MVELPEPLTPVGCDLRDFPYMPLDVVRLRDSDMAAVEDPEAFRAAVLLWCASWHQVPAASLPDDDASLARLAGYGRDLATWRAVKAGGALRNWARCSDGRLYHPVVAEKAREAWDARQSHRNRLASAREALARKREDAKRAKAGHDDASPPQTPARPETMGGDHTDTGEVTGQDTTPEPDTVAAPDTATDTVTGLKGREGKGRESTEKENQLAAESVHRRANGAEPFMPARGDPPERWMHLAEKAEVDKFGERRPVVGGFYLDMVADEVCEAAGLKQRWRGDWRTLIGWLQAGIDPNETILPTIRSVASRPSYKPPRVLSYFDGPISEVTEAA